jgi:hypothetical protein
MYRPPLWNGFAAAGCYAARVDRVVDNVCFGSGTEILMTSTDVRFTPESGHLWSRAGMIEASPSSAPVRADKLAGTIIATAMTGTK